MNGLFDFLGGAIKPITDLVDNLHTSGEEKGALENQKLEIKNRLEKMTNEMQSKVISYETKLMTLRSQAIVSEAGGKSWIQRNWRPITMLTFVGLFVLEKFALLGISMTPDEIGLIKLGLTGYVAGRSAEKVAQSVSEGLKGLRR